MAEDLRIPEGVSLELDDPTLELAPRRPEWLVRWLFERFGTRTEVDIWISAHGYRCKYREAVLRLGYSILSTGERAVFTGEIEKEGT